MLPHKDKFLAMVKAKREPNTYKSYKMALRRFAQWAMGREIVPSMVEEFSLSLSEQGLARQSIVSYTTAVVVYVKWMADKGLANFTLPDLKAMNDDAAEWRQRRQVPKVPPEDTVQAIRQVAAVSNPTETDRLKLYHLCNRAFIEILAETGCRVSEAAGLLRKDMDPATMTVWARSTKGKQDRRLIFKSRQGWDAVVEYLEERDKAGLKTVGKEPVLAAHDKVAWGKQELHAMHTNSLRAKLHRMCRQAGVEHITPHTLRHRKATRMLHETGNLDYVRRVLGHQSADTTGIYLQVTDDDLIKAVRGENA